MATSATSVSTACCVCFPGTREAPAASHRSRLGIIWYLFPDESHTADGKFTGYLEDEGDNHKKFRACDPALYDALRRLVTAAERNVVAVRQSEVLPCSTAYFEPSLSYSPHQPRSSRQAARRNWIRGALDATVESDVVFVDPDNGISETADPWRKNGPKFVFFDDLRRFAGTRPELGHLPSPEPTGHPPATDRTLVQLATRKSWTDRCNMAVTLPPGVRPRFLRGLAGTARVRAGNQNPRLP